MESHTTLLRAMLIIAVRVLIGIAPTQDASALLTAVKRFAWPAATAMNVLCVSERVHPSMLELMGATMQEIQQRHDLDASTAASEAAADLRNAGFMADGSTVDGDPKTRIVEYAKNWNADLIVVGADTAPALKRVLLGSVAGSVVTNAHCSVLVLRAAPL
jgi:nucleotide-binding universal stress UspA family protein